MDVKASCDAIPKCKVFDLLDAAGVFQFLDKKAESLNVSVLVRDRDVLHFRSRLAHAAIITEASGNQEVSELTEVLIDCRPGNLYWSPIDPVLPRSMSLFTDVVAWYLAAPESIPKHQVPGKRYFIISTPRSGSTFLCDLLTSTQCLGAPTEHLKPWLKEYLVVSGLTFPSLMDGLHRYGATDNGVFGTKVIIDDLFKFLADFSDDTLEELRRATVFFLIRGDKSAQAISNVRSNKVGIYHVHDSLASQSQLSALAVFEPNIDDVFSKERWLLRQEADLLELLYSRAIFPQVVSYESYTQSRQGARTVVRHIAKSIGADLEREFIWPRLIKISTALPHHDHPTYEVFRTRTRLYSTRSEPWLGSLLGRGWGKLENWGVRTECADVELKIPDLMGIEVMELLINVDPETPEILEVGAITLTLPDGRTEQGLWRLLIRVDLAADMKNRTIPLHIPYIPHIADMIWREFPPRDQPRKALTGMPSRSRIWS